MGDASGTLVKTCVVLPSMNVLVGNDDGVHSPGIKALANAISQDFAVTVACPDRERSATGHALTIQQPIRVEPVCDYFAPAVTAWACSGTPSDAMKLALDALMPVRPHLVLSGINRGPNLGTDVLYSGTVSAAMEGVLEGVTSIAFSLTSFTATDFSVAAAFARHMVAAIAANPLPEPMLLNVNIPAIPAEDLRGVVVTRLGVRRYRDVFEKRVHPRGRVYYWLVGEAIEEDAPPDTDVQAIRDNYITVTPLKYDLTLDAALPGITAWAARALGAVQPFSL